MKFGLSEEQFKLLQTLIAEPLKNNHAQVFVFGSRARGDHHKFSDIDLLFVEDDRFPVSSALLSDLNEKAEDSNLVIKVDLVNSKDLAQSYRTNVERDKVRI